MTVNSSINNSRPLEIKWADNNASENDNHNIISGKQNEAVSQRYVWSHRQQQRQRQLLK